MFVNVANYRYDNVNKIDITERVYGCFKSNCRDLESVKIYRISVLTKNYSTYIIRYWAFIRADCGTGLLKFKLVIITNNSFSYDENHCIDLIVMHQLNKDKHN